MWLLVGKLMLLLLIVHAAPELLIVSRCVVVLSALDLWHRGWQCLVWFALVLQSTHGIFHLVLSSGGPMEQVTLPWHMAYIVPACSKVWFGLLYCDAWRLG
jgi:hypothetical protein